MQGGWRPGGPMSSPPAPVVDPGQPESRATCQPPARVARAAMPRNRPGAILGEGGGRSITMATAIGSDLVDVEEAPWARWLFASRAAAWIWLVARMWVSYEWLHSGWEKITGPGHDAGADRAADTPRAGGAGAAGRGQPEPGHRRRARAHPRHGQKARRPCPGQARRHQPHRGRRPGAVAGPARQEL